jgi:A/G-specific adenine glycosylase
MLHPAKDSGHASVLLAWYDRHRRSLPWRAPAGARPDPYRVWLSEVMLQQTTVAAAVPYYERFLARWETVEALAAASLDEVLAAWAGLGYYARARNLHKCAQAVAGELGGRFPDSERSLRALPGIGAYTAAAIAAIAFDRPAVVVDGNVERVIARLFAVETPLPEAKPRLHAHAAALAPRLRPGDYAQAVMDLGATVCTVARPRCEGCPWASRCAGLARGVAAALPRRAPRRAKPLRRGIALWIERADGAVLLRRRPAKGLLGGMLEVPSTAWAEGAPDAEAAKAEAPVAVIRWRRLPGVVRHTFTHFRLELAVLAARAAEPATAGLWCPPDALAAEALPSVMRKVAAHALAGPPVWKD